jgi:hypothetical protein
VLQSRVDTLDVSRAASGAPCGRATVPAYPPVRRIIGRGRFRAVPGIDKRIRFRFPRFFAYPRHFRLTRLSPARYPGVLSYKVHEDEEETPFLRAPTLYIAGGVRPHTPDRAGRQASNLSNSREPPTLHIASGVRPHTPDMGSMQNSRLSSAPFILHSILSVYHKL